MKMDTFAIIGYIAVMAGMTYAIRAIPLTFFRKDITNAYIRSFFKYIPYAVLGSMTLPAILYSTSSMLSAAAGLAVAALLSYREKSLLTVAVSACVAVFVVELFL